jgi:hypothetical protein
LRQAAPFQKWSKAGGGPVVAAQRDRISLATAARRKYRQNLAISRFFTSGFRPVFRLYLGGAVFLAFIQPCLRFHLQVQRLLVSAFPAEAYKTPPKEH